MSAIPRKDSMSGLFAGASDKSFVPTALEETVRLSDLHARIQRLSRLLLEGGGLYAFVDEMQTLLGQPAALVLEPDRIWLSADLREGEPDRERKLLLAMLPPSVSGEPQAAGYVKLTDGGRAFVSPLSAVGGKRASLVLLERRRPFEAIDAASVERLAPLAGLELANVEAVREVESRYLDRFLQDWLNGKIVSENDWKLRAEVCGCVLPKRAKLCAALVGFSGPEVPSGERLAELAALIRSASFHQAEPPLAVPVGAELALIVPVPFPLSHQRELHAAAPADSALRGLLGELRSLTGDAGLRLFAGRAIERPELLPVSLSQARRARQVSEVCGMAEDSVTYDRLGVYSLLYLIPSGEEREQFLQRYSQPLQQADRRGGGRLAETLEMFFRCNGNIKLTSKRLFAHYNTVVYRLEKIQQILSVSLDDPEDRLQLQLALRLGQMSSGSAETN
ncbi:PucR family transcriptional regulator [Cohnella zeiphila]|uniref:Helix-turn-helix domain-containing protein n=1 Tax=Cohnella zeiphila TaxID=2761120 RepID=A0A7X0SKH9_9BACL|nr:helix-turn-helix domain-containing protein [Cohnella zeiphila]MBB6731611.1 helix-turn-helix domain-containing protein [Cohnella zeiphila]